jgi:hypothetical protein
MLLVPRFDHFSLLEIGIVTTELDACGSDDVQVFCSNGDGCSGLAVDRRFSLTSWLMVMSCRGI